VGCFKPFRTIFKKKKGNAMVRNNHYKLSKHALASWVDKALDQTLSKKNTMSRFKVIGIWPFNPKAMDHKTRPCDVYIIEPIDIVNENNDAIYGIVYES